MTKQEFYSALPILIGLGIFWALSWKVGLMLTAVIFYEAWVCDAEQRSVIEDRRKHRSKMHGDYDYDYECHISS